jgi:hypothetical protein
MRLKTMVDLPVGLLNDNRYSNEIEPINYLEPRLFHSRYEMVEYLHPIITELRLQDKFYNPGLWAWISAFYFDSVCPIENNIRRPGENERHIPPMNRTAREYNLHLIAPGVRIYDTHGIELTKLLLYGRPYYRSTFLHELISSQDLSMSSGVLEALQILYWDEEKQGPKSGATTQNKPGALNRFIRIANQINLTYDLQAMNGHQILNLLPSREFSRWMPKPTRKQRID